MSEHSFEKNGYVPAKGLIDKSLLKKCKLEFARLIAEPAYIKQAMMLRSLFKQSPDKFSHEVSIDSIPSTEIYIGHSPIEFSTHFRELITSEQLWGLAADCLKVDVSALVLNLVQIIRKPARIGPRLSWHRDFANKYISTIHANDMIRILMPLQDYVDACGATAVIPASHHVQDMAVINKLAIDESICEQNSRIIPLFAGDVLALHAKLIHGGGFNTSDIDRDQLVIQLAKKGADYRYWEEAAKHEAFFLCSRNQIGVIN